MSLSLFLESCKSQFTKDQYSLCLRKYLDFAGELPNNRDVIEAKIIEFIISLKNEGMSFYAVSNYVVHIKSFYAINNVTLNTKKLGKFMPEMVKTTK